MKKLFTFLALSCIINSLQAQDGTLDSTYGINGLSVLKNVGDKSDFPATMFITSEGKNVEVGSAATDSNTHYLLVRRNEDGTLDKQFGNNGIALADVDGRDGNASSAVELPDGKYMLVGNSLKKNFSKYNLILMRFNKNGSVDSAFGNNGSMAYSIGDDYSNDYPASLMLQPDGKLVAAGYTTYLGQYVFFAARFLPDGRRDPSFGYRGIKLIPFETSNLFGNNAILQPDGKIIIIGSLQTTNYEFDFAIVRLNSDGSLDKTFGRDGKVITDFGGNNDFAYGIALQRGKKIIVAGYYNAGNKANAAIIRYNENGSVDKSFGKNGKTAAALPNASINCFSVAVQPDNKIVAGCTAWYLSGTKSDYALFRFNADGAPDINFGNKGQVITSVTDGFDGINTVRTNAKGKILVAGSSQTKAGISKLSEAQYVTTYQTFANTLVSSNQIIDSRSTTEQVLIIYPNPVKDHINLKAAWTSNEYVNIQICNEEGKVLFNQKYFISNENDILKLTLNANWKAGNYYIKVNGSKIFKGSFSIIK
jgi:uncharacterized delta-60 repeat protein